MSDAFESVQAVQEALDEPTVDARTLHAIWSVREPIPKPAGRSGDADSRHDQPRLVAWMHKESLAAEFVEHALGAGEYLLACDAANEALRAHSTSVPVRQYLARALARLGSAEEALRILDQVGAGVVMSPAARSQNLLLTGQLQLETAEGALEEEVRTEDLARALRTFRRACELRPGEPAPVVEAATAALLLGDAHRAEAREMAARALHLIDSASVVRHHREEDLLIGRARVLAILGDVEGSRAAWKELRTLADLPLQAVADARRQARRLAVALAASESSFDDCFPPLRLVVFSGHMIDQADRRRPRFPAALEDRVRGLIRAGIADPEIDARVSFSSAAAGSDLIFLEEMLERTAKVHVVLPWSRDEFVATSVAPFGQPWVERFHAALTHAASVRILGELHRPSDAVSFEYANAVLAGLATLRARELHLDLLPMVVWDGEPGLPGGTGSFVEYWRSRLVPVHEIPLERIGAAVGPAAEGHAKRAESALHAGQPSNGMPHAHPHGAGPHETFQQEVRAMLFADIVGYSRLPESLIPAFIHEFLGRVSRIESESPNAPVSVNTWGDAVYFVFETAENAGLFALELTEMIENAPWADLGLTWKESVDGRSVVRPLGIRTGLHAGPVFIHMDPVVRRLGFTGAHVSRAARIEPVAEPGQVFASEEFAALAAAEGVQGFVCDFVGTMPLAKKYPGEFRIHRLRRPRRLPIEQIARVIHEDYTRKAIERGETPRSSSSLKKWEDLPEELQRSNRSQAAHIRTKLRELLGYDFETAPGRGEATLQMSPEQEELLARAEHERWCDSKRAAGWTYGPVRDDARKVHDCLVLWEELPEAERAKDFDAVRNIPRLLALAGFRVRRLDGA